MADKIKKFFKNKKIDNKFKKAGPGYRLDESSSQSSISSSNYQPLPNRSGLTQESKQAAEAALARLNKQQKNENPFNRSLSAIKAQIKREMEAERQAASSLAPAPKFVEVPEVELESTPLLAVQGVYFRCPLLGPDILTREEWNQKIREFLNEQLLEEKGLTACLMLHTLNKRKEKIEACIETISKYFENILKNPTEEKFRKIRLSNKVYQEKIKPMEGAQLILESAGFEIKELPFQDGKENFLVFPIEKLPEASETFEMLMDGLRNAEPITLELYRNMQVLLPEQAKERNELPPSFFNLTVEEIKKEQMLRTEALERNQMLRTKAMRERDEIKEIRKYKFSLIRVRFPDGIFLQGTFGVYEKVSSILEFVREALDEENLNFTLTTPNGQQIRENSEATLVDEKLVPAAILIFTTKISRQSYLKPEIITSEDVIHSSFLPLVEIEMRVLPIRLNWDLLDYIRPSVIYSQCAEVYGKLSL